MYQTACVGYQKREVVCPVQHPKVAVKCPHCGGTTVKLKDVSSVCGYCGRLLSGEF